MVRVENEGAVSEGNGISGAGRCRRPARRRPQELRRQRGPEGDRPQRRERRGADDHRPQRQRQEHAAAVRQPARAAESGNDLFEGEEITRKGVDVSAVRHADRDGLPAVQPLSAPDRDDNLTLATRRIGSARRRRRRNAGTSCSRASALREGRPAPASALRRPAAARRDRAGADDGAARDAVRRGHVGAGPGARRRGADRDARPRREGMTMLVVTHEMQFARRSAIDSSSWTRAESSRRGFPRCAGSPPGGADAAVPAPLAPARRLARRVVSHRRGRSTCMKRILLATAGVAVVAVFRRDDRLRAAHGRDGRQRRRRLRRCRSCRRKSPTGSGSSSASSAIRRRSATWTFAEERGCRRRDRQVVRPLRLRA